MNEDLLRYNKEAVFCTYDFEGESLNLYASKPWQFACILATQDKIIEKHDIFIKWPNLNLSKGAEIVTKIDYARWEREGIAPKDALKIINGCFNKGDYIVGHNLLGYDNHIYRSMCRMLKREPLPAHNKILDTFCLMKGLAERLDIPYQKGSDLLEYQMKMVHKIVRKRGFATLGALCKLFDIDYDKNKAHDALYDVEVNFKAFKKMLWKIEI